MTPVTLIGKGRIGTPVARWLAQAPGYRLAGVIGRDGEVREGEAAPLSQTSARGNPPTPSLPHKGGGSREIGKTQAVGSGDPELSTHDTTHPPHFIPNVSTRDPLPPCGGGMGWGRGATSPDATSSDPPTTPLFIDTAGPEALRSLGPALLERGELWTVGAAALIDPGLLARLEGIARRTGHRLRLFTGWIAGPALVPLGTGRLHVLQSAPGLGPAPGPLFHGPLAEAAARFPDHLNTATAAALCGPGIAATSIELHSTAPGTPHIIRARHEVPGQTLTSETRIGEGPHPVAEALIAALQRRMAWMTYG